ncbi:MAG: hypothetical protein A3B03_00130 [Candidatus Zambryskibacteria bacterium RIFCSPLOWO2_01_FULL_42_41]|nr:MAG: hypothetical protein A2829_02365 [Candidatus Zambryskibacteria bacterium RIFCSPHIGHO2_01_FULL_43_60]OHB02811.1 MAG: hypothetical protein A3B03_00130 [Candidatus Zambryskibacteria bacterium RIFCSPLOWO2_01_FULL_42_41]
MGDFQELLKVDKKETFNFFYLGLRDRVPAEKVVDAETKYTASILASFAQTSSCDMVDMPPFSSLSEIFDHFVLPGSDLRDPALLALAGAQSLFLLGIFPNQMARRYNLQWYGKLGQSFYRQAGQYAGSRQERELYNRLSNNFSIWTSAYKKLNRELYENRFVLLIP